MNSFDYRITLILNNSLSNEYLSDKSLYLSEMVFHMFVGVMQILNNVFVNNYVEKANPYYSNSSKMIFHIIP